MDSLVRLKGSEHYMLAHRQFCCGGSLRDVQRLLERAADQVESAMGKRNHD